MGRIKLMMSHNSIPPMVAALLFGLAFLILSGPWWCLFLIVLGIPAQMLNEYNLHRFIFHLPPPRNQTAFNLLYQAHYGHHDFPTNKPLFFAPIWVSLPVLVLNFMVVLIIARWLAPGYAMSIASAIVLVGGVGTFLAYEWFHMTAHLPVQKTRIERHVTTLHNQHHFRDFSKWFHVSPGGEIIDKAMGTSINRDQLKQQQRIEFIRTLGLEPNDPRLIEARRHFADKYELTSAEIERAAKA